MAGQDAFAKSPSPQSQHRRGYQACDPCRKRKVKCDLGSMVPLSLSALFCCSFFFFMYFLPDDLQKGVDNPRPPPCVRCRRESKRCEFSATRRKRKQSDAAEEPVEAGVLHRDKRMMIGEVAQKETSSDDLPFPPSEHTSFDSDGIRARQKWSEPSLAEAASQRYTPSAPTAPAPSFSESRNLRMSMYPLGDRNASSSYGLEGGQPMMNRTAVELLSPAISNTHDALHLLSEAAGRTEDLNRQRLENRYGPRQSVSSFNSGPSPLAQGSSPRSLGGSYSRTPRQGGANYYQGTSGPVDPQISEGGGHRESPATTQDPGYVDAVRAWSRLRFVRAGWLTVEEGMDYVA
jgi:hypothetical protein